MLLAITVLRLLGGGGNEWVGGKEKCAHVGGGNIGRDRGGEGGEHGGGREIQYCEGNGM